MGRFSRKRGARFRYGMRLSSEKCRSSVSNSDIIDRIRDHIKKAPPRKGRFDLNKAIDEVIALAGSAITTNGVSVRTRLAGGVAPIPGDRGQLQQDVLDFIPNAGESTSTVEAGAHG